MASRGSGRSGPRRALLGVLVLALVVVVAGAGLAVWRPDVLDRILGTGATSPSSDPALVPPPPGLSLPAVAAPAPVATPVDQTRAEATGADRIDPAVVRRVLTRHLDDPHLGRHQLAVVAPLVATPGQPDPAYRLGRGTATPASTTKLVTTTAALLALGPQHTFTTSVVSAHGRVVLVGGGDPYLERTADDPDLAGVPVGADLASLARRTAQKLRAHGTSTVRVGYDDSLFTGPAVNPDWQRTYIPEGVVSPIGSLWVDEGRTPDRLGRVAAPAASAADDFATVLRQAGLTVRGAPTRVPHASGRTLAAMSSAPLGRIVEHILQVSDNEGAEVLLRQVGLAEERQGSSEAGRRAVLDLLTHAGVTFGSGRTRTVLHDGSGLARDDRMDPMTLVDVIRLAASADHPGLRPVVTGLPVAGFSGSLATRMDDGPPAGLGRVRAKTGTLTGVSSLAGIAVDRDDVPLVFVLMADRIPDAGYEAARIAQDDAAAELGACRCSR